MDRSAPPGSGRTPRARAGAVGQEHVGEPERIELAGEGESKRGRAGRRRSAARMSRSVRSSTSIPTARRAAYSASSTRSVLAAGRQIQAGRRPPGAPRLGSRVRASRPMPAPPRRKAGSSAPRAPGRPGRSGRTRWVSISYWMRAVVAEVLPRPISPASSTTVEIPSPANRWATSAPVIPPPMTATSQRRSRWRRGIGGGKAVEGGPERGAAGQVHGRMYPPGRGAGQALGRRQARLRSSLLTGVDRSGSELAVPTYSPARVTASRAGL